MRQFARKSRNLIIAYKILQNWRMKRRFASGQIETEHGSSHSSKSLAESLDYIEEQFQDYLTYGELNRSDLVGKRILELGFGDNVGVALKFLAAGAEQVVCVDKFYSKRDSGRERDIYQAMRERLSVSEKQRFDEALRIDKSITFNEARLRPINGLDLAVAAGQLQRDSQLFDIILSRAVIEEIYDPAAVLGAADALLKPAGLMLHKIDLSDYGMFSDAGMHPLTFLTIPAPVYSRMATDSGIPNRKLISYYRDLMNGLLYDSRFLVTAVVGHGTVAPHCELSELNKNGFAKAIPVIEEIRGKLAREFRDLSNEELMVQGIFVRAKKGRN